MDTLDNFFDSLQNEFNSLPVDSQRAVNLSVTLCAVMIAGLMLFFTALSCVVACCKGVISCMIGCNDCLLESKKERSMEAAVAASRRNKRDSSLYGDEESLMRSA